MTTLGIDATGQLTSVTDPTGQATQIAWAKGGLITSETDALGRVSRFTYDQDGRLVAFSDADGVTQQLSRMATATSIEVRATTALGRVTTYRSEMAADGGVTRTVVDPDGTTTTETTSADGSRTLASPDGTRRSIGAASSVAWGMDAPVLTPDVLTRPDGVTSTTTVQPEQQEVGGLPYALAGTVTTTVNGQASAETFDPASRTTTIIDAAGRKTIDTYDTVGRVEAESAPGTPSTAYTYDRQGREASVTVGAGASARTTRFAYDATTGVETVTRPDGSTVKLSVDANGDLTTQTAADGSTVVAAYDATGRLTQLQPAGGLSFTLGYSAAGRPTAFLPPSAGGDASAEVTAYDADGQAVSVTGLGPSSVAYAYDAAGRPAGWTSNAGKDTVSYDPSTGLEATSSDPDGVSTAYGYAGSVPDKLAWSGALNGSVAITIDANGRASRETVDGTQNLGLTYDGAGNLATVGDLSFARDRTSGLVTATALGIVSTQQHYDGDDQLVRSTTLVAGTRVLDLQYTRDALGRISSVVEVTPSGSTTTSYAYDGSDRLARVQVDGKTVETDTYDAAGNRTVVTAAPGSRKGSYDARDRLTSWGDTTYGWAANGSLTDVTRSTGTTSLNYDDLGNLRAVTLPGGRAVTYLVDADGRRIGRAVGGSLVAGYLYDTSGRVAAETDRFGAVVEQFGYDDQGHLALAERGARTYRVITDPVGSPLLVIDSQGGTVAEAITYDAWGRMTNDTAPGFIPFGFGGGLVDPDTGLVHLGARDYDPTTGRWTAPDPIRFAGGDANLYRYVGADPVNRVDPSGLLTCGQSKWVLAAGLTLLLFGGPGVGTGIDIALNLHCPPEPVPPPPPPGSGGGSGKTFTCTHVVCIHGPLGSVCVGASTDPCSIADTHIHVADNVHFDFQAAGEFIAAVSAGGGFEIQARQEPALGGTLITFNTAVAASVEGDRVGVYAAEPSFLMVNGKPVSAVDVAEQLPHGGTLERHGGLVTIVWPDGGHLTIARHANTLDYGFIPSAAVGPTIRGLLGNLDGNPANDLAGRDGQPLSVADPAFATKLYAQFGDSWRIAQDESLFDYWPGESTTTFTRPDIPSAPVTAATLSASARADALTVCRAVGVQAGQLLDDCLLDVGMTGDASFAANSAAVAAAAVTTGAGATQPAEVTPITVGQRVSGTIASPAQEDHYTFTGNAGEIVYVQAHDACAAGLDWTLLGPDGGSLAGSLTCNDLQRLVLGTEGTYTIDVNGDRSATGDYSFSVLAVPATTTTPLSLGQAVADSLGEIGQWADYSFTAAAGQVVYGQHGATCTSGITWEVIDPAGRAVAGTSACNDIGRVALESGGRYTIRVAGDHTTTGGFAFSVLTVPATRVTPISIGQAVSGSIGAAGQWVEYAFPASAGQVVNLQASKTCVAGLNWALIWPDELVRAGTATCADIGRQVLATAGTYTIRVYGDNASIGAYGFTLSATK